MIFDTFSASARLSSQTITDFPFRSRFARWVLFLFLGAAVGLFFPRPAAAAEYRFYQPAPVGVLHVARPTITWKVWPTDAALRVTRVALSVNGVRLSSAVYSEAERAVVYVCIRPLAPGDYRVSCQIQFARTQPTSPKEWTFTVASDAVANLPDPTEEQQDALALANKYRRLLGLPDFLMDARLCAAAGAHSEYMNRNGQIGHAQQAGRVGFVASRSWERMAAFGYAGGSYENVEYGSPTRSGALRGLFDAPYHRIPFMQPGAPVFGAGFAGKAATVLFGTTEDEATICSPCDGQRNVPLLWDGNETPNPLRIHEAEGRGPVGYPITLVHFSPNKTPLRVLSATLVAAPTGSAVPCWLNTPQNDDFLKYGVVLIPQKPLQPRTTYQVTVRAQTEAGAEVSRAWRFTTGATPAAAPWLEAAAPKL